MLPNELKTHLDELGGYDRPTIHIAGSKGKGTTAFLISEILTMKGKTVGQFLSPFILHERECITINGKEIPESEHEDLMNKMDDELSRFEKMTLASLVWFQQNNCDYVVVETGWGGRDDATNIIDSKVLTILSHVELEHTAILGSSIEAIAERQLGIGRPGVPMITEQGQSHLAPDAVYSEPYKLGHHHPESVGYALKAMELLDIEVSDNELEKFAETQLIGRFEVLKYGPHTLIIDGAHTIDSVSFVRDQVIEYVAQSDMDHIHWCVHFLNDKPDELSELFPTTQISWIEIEDERAGTNPSNLPSCSVDEMLKVIENLKEPQVFAFVGSFRLVATLKRAMNPNLPQ